MGDDHSDCGRCYRHGSLRALVGHIENMGTRLSWLSLRLRRQGRSTNARDGLHRLIKSCTFGIPNPSPLNLHLDNIFTLSRKVFVAFMAIVW